MSGFLYDMLGRRKVVTGIFLIGAAATIGTPLVAPSIIGYDFMRIGFVSTIGCLISNPFINDYVKVTSRGVATG